MEDIDAAIQVMLYEGKSKNSTNQVNNSNRFQQTVLLIFFFLSFAEFSEPTERKRATK